MRNFLSLIFVLMSVAVSAGPTLSDNAKLSLLTCSPGNEIYSTFGHNAIRVMDFRNGVIIDSVYNYGTFSFEQPNFTLNFARGKLNYSLTTDVFAAFQYDYIYEGRGIEEQVLNLTQVQKQSLYDALCINARPENRDYKYDFFFDNCATRIRDMVQEHTGEVVYVGVEGERTFRELIQLYLNTMPWSDFGIDLALGMPCDRIATPEEEMFLPDFLHDVFNQSSLGNKALIENDEMLLGQDSNDAQFPISPMQAAFIYLGVSVLLLIVGWKFPFFRKLALRIHLIVGGLLGLMLILLWFATDHTITANNLNVLWAWPAHLFFLASSFTKQFSRVYLWVFVLLQAVLLVFWNAWPQDFHEAFIPLVVAHLLSGIVHLQKTRKNG